MKVRIAILAFVVSIASSVAVAQNSIDNQAAKQMFYLVNEARANEGLALLKWNDQLADPAEQHAKLMADHKSISHEYEGERSVQLRLADTGLHMDRSGENVAADSTIKGADIGLMNSPPHRANILSPHYNSIGIGVAQRDGIFYVVEDFARVLPTLSADETEKRVALAFEQLRRDDGLRPLKRRHSEELRRRACEMAKTDNVSARDAASPAARYTAAFTTSDPAQLPQTVEKFGNKTDVGSIGVGACFARTASYPAGVYWVILELYSNRAGATSE